MSTARFIRFTYVPVFRAGTAAGALAAVAAFVALLIAACLLVPAEAGATAAVTGTWVVPTGTGNTITWDSVAGATEYRVYESTTQGVTGPLVATVPAPNLTLARTGLTNGTSYYYTVRAFDGVSESTDPVTSVVAIPGATITPARFFINCNAVIDGKVYLFGGWDTAAQNVIWQFDPMTGTSGNTGWTLPVNRYDCGADATQRVAVLGAGGAGGFGAGGMTNGIITFTPGANAVASAFTMPQAVVSNAAAMLNGKFISFGGHTACATNSNVISQANVPVTGNAVGVSTTSSARSEGAIAKIGGTAYTFGGLDNACFGTIPLTITASAVSDKYVQATNTRTAIAPMPTAYGASGASSLNDMIYVFGGVSGGSTRTASIRRYDPRSNTWVVLGTTMAVANAYPTIARIRGTIYIIAGSVGTGTVVGNVYRFNEGGQSRGVPAAPAATAPSALVVTPGNTQATVSWTAGAGAEHYLVWRSTVAGERGQLIEESAGNIDSPLVSVVDTGLVNGTTYYYRVSALGQDDVETAATAAVSATPSVGGSVTISGFAFEDEAPVKWTGCDGVTANVSLSVNGGAKVSTTCSAVTGAYSFAAVSLPGANVPVVVYLDNNAAGNDGVTYTRNVDTTSNITGLDVTKSRVRIRSESATNITNAAINAYDSTQDTDVPIASDGTNVVTNNSTELHVDTGETYAPGGGVSASSLHLEGTYQGGAETLLLRDSGVGACTAGPGTARPLCVAAGSFVAPASTVYAGTGATNVAGGLTYSSLSLQPTGGSPTYSLGNAAAQTVTITGNLVVGDGVNAVTVTTTTFDPIVNVGTGAGSGAVTINASATVSGSGSSPWRVTGSASGAGTWNMTAGSVEQRVSGAASFGPTGGNQWCFWGLNFTNASGVADQTITLTKGTSTGICTWAFGVGTGGDAFKTIVDAETNDPGVNDLGDFVVSTKGTYLASSSATLTISGNFTNSSVFTANTGTVVFNDRFDNGRPTSVVTYASPTTFSSLTVISPSKTLQFDNVDQTNVTGALTVNGAACGTPVSLQSDLPGSQAELNVTGTHSIQYANVRDLNAVAALTASNSTDQLNNLNIAVTAGLCPRSISPSWMSGFESGVVSTAGGGVVDAVQGSGLETISTSTVRNGQYSLRVAPGAPGGWVRMNTSGSPTTLVVRAAVRLEQLPTGAGVNHTLVTSRTLSNGNIRSGNISVTSTGVLKLGFQNAALVEVGTVSGPTIAAGQWYLIEETMSTVGTTWTASWRVDGVSYAPSTVAGMPASDPMTQVQLGTGAVTDYVAYYDDVVISQTPADYPIGDGKVLGLRPDGTVGVNANFSDEVGGAFGVWSFLKVDDSPMAPITDYVRQDTDTSGTQFAELSLENAGSTVTARAVRGVAAYHTEGGAAATASSRFRSGATETPVYTGAMGSASVLYKGAMLTAPGGGWTPANLNALTARIGYATAITGKPAWDGLLAEVEIPNAPSNEPSISIRVDGYAVGGAGPVTAPAAAAFGLILPSVDYVTEARVTVTTDALNGYTLAALDLDGGGAVNAGAAPVPWMNCGGGCTVPAPGVWSGNGIAISAFGGASTRPNWCNGGQVNCPSTGAVAELSDTDLRWAPLTGTSQQLTSKATSAPAGDTTRVPIRANLAPAQASGTYSGEILLVAVAAP